MQINIRPLGMTLGSIKGIIPRLMSVKLKQENISYTFDQMVVLIIVRYAARAQQDIAELMQKDKSIILRIVDVLENDGLLFRTADPKDRRRNIINLTEKGFEITDRFKAIETEITKELLKGLKEEDIEAFYKVIDHIHKTAENL